MREGVLDLVPRREGDSCAGRCEVVLPIVDCLSRAFCGVQILSGLENVLPMSQWLSSPLTSSEGISRSDGSTHDEFEYC